MVRRFVFVAFLFAAPLFAQPVTSPLTRGLADALYCKLAIGCPGFSGTVTSVGNGTIGSLFTATWATATTTPALNFDITNQGTVAQVLHGNAAGHPSFGAVVSADLNVTGITCSNQFLTVLSSSLAGTCTTATLAGAQFANQGTTTTLLHGAAAGNPSWGPVVSADLNITASMCTNQFLTAISATGIGTCTALTLAAFPTIATNTVLGNATSGTAVPTELAVSTCSGASNALNWTTNTGFGCNGSIAASSATTATTATNAAITDDTTTNATVFPLWVTASTGNLPAKVSSTKLGFNPSTGNITISSTSKMGWGSSGITTPDTFLVREAANTLAMNNGATPQLLRIYNTDDGAGNVERGSVAWSSNVLIFQTSQTGTGAARDVNMGPSGAAAVCLRTAATCRLNIAAGGDLTMAAGNSTGQCTLNGAATSTCTHTVPAACVPICTYNSGATPHTIACSVSTTTLTAVSATTLDNGVVNYHCF